MGAGSLGEQWGNAIVGYSSVGDEDKEESLGAPVMGEGEGQF